MAFNKSKFFGLALLASMLQLSPAWSEEVANVDAPAADGKVYVQNRAVRIMDKNIVVFTKDGAFVAKTLYSDENGAYVQANDMEKVKVFGKNKFGGKKKFGVRKGGCCNKDKRAKGLKKNEGKKNGWKNRGWKKWKRPAKAQPAPAVETTPAVVADAAPAILANDMSVTQ